MCTVHKLWARPVSVTCQYRVITAKLIEMFFFCTYPTIVFKPKIMRVYSKYQNKSKLYPYKLVDYYDNNSKIRYDIFRPTRA